MKGTANTEKFFKLSDGKWLKIVFRLYHGYKQNSWYVTIVVAKTRRKCNDSIRKTAHSPKNLRYRSTGGKVGIEALRLALQEILNFETRLKIGDEIVIEGSDAKRQRVYAWLTRYSYVAASHFAPNKFFHKHVYYFKPI